MEGYNYRQVLNILYGTSSSELIKLWKEFNIETKYIESMNDKPFVLETNDDNGLRVIFDKKKNFKEFIEIGAKAGRYNAEDPFISYEDERLTSITGSWIVKHLPMESMAGYYTCSQDILKSIVLNHEGLANSLRNYWGMLVDVE